MLPRKNKLNSNCNEILYALEKSIWNSCQKVSKDKMKESYLRHLFPENTIDYCRDAYGLNMEKDLCFLYWPVFLGAQSSEINICAVNLGISTLYDRYAQGGLDELQSDEIISCAFNTLVVSSMTLQNNNSTLRFWPTHIDFTNRLEFGTIIQSILSLSTLHKIGFLSESRIYTENDKTERVLENRIRFIMEALNWIVYLDEANDPMNSAWSYAENCIEPDSGKSIINAIIPSEYSFEVLRKYFDLFTENEHLKKIVSSIDNGFIQKLKRICKNYTVWFLREQCSDGGFRTNSNQKSSSFPFSCSVLSFFFFAGLEEPAHLTALKKLIYFFVKQNKGFAFSFSEVCDAYNFKYHVSDNEGYVKDAYEIIPEAVLFLNSCLLLDKYRNTIPKKTKKQMRQLNYRCLESILSRIHTIEIDKTGQNTVVRGRNEAQGFHYPIYAIYYVHCCVKQYLQNENLSKNTKQSLLSRPPAINGRVIFVSLFLVLLVLLSAFISLTDTLTSIILSVVSFLTPLLIDLIRRNKNKSK